MDLRMERTRQKKPLNFFLNLNKNIIVKITKKYVAFSPHTPLIDAGVQSIIYFSVKNNNKKTKLKYMIVTKYFFKRFFFFSL